MEETGEMLELRVKSWLVDSALIFSYPWGPGGLSLLWTFLVLRIRNAGDIPFFTNFSLTWFYFTMVCLWLLARWIYDNYTVAYQFNPTTQEVNLTRTIAGHPFKIFLAEISEIYATAIQTHWFDSKGVREWSYTLCLVTRAAKIIRLSPEFRSPPCLQAGEIAQKLGVLSFPCQEQTGPLIAWRDSKDQLQLAYRPAPSIESQGLQLLKLIVLAPIVLVLALLAICLLR